MEEQQVINDYSWRHAIVAQWRAMEDWEGQLIRVMVEQGLTLRQMVAIFHVWLSLECRSNAASQDEVC
jgi:hypothetical protein